MTRNILLSVVVFAFISGCANLSPPPKNVEQTKSFKEIVKLLPKVQKGNTREKVESILGMPQDKRCVRPGYCTLFYHERPGEFGIMNTILITCENNLVSEVEESEISIDPW